MGFVVFRLTEVVDLLIEVFFATSVHVVLSVDEYKLIEVTLLKFNDSVKFEVVQPWLSR